LYSLDMSRTRGVKRIR